MIVRRLRQDPRRQAKTANQVEFNSAEGPTGLMRSARCMIPLGLFLGLGVMFLLTEPLGAQTGTATFVELNSPVPTAVASFQAAEAGQAFDPALYRASVLLSQDNFLQQLTASGITYTLTNTTLQLASGTVTLPDRYTDLINAIHMVVAPADVARIRANPNVRDISVDVPRQLDLNTSVPYIRANCPPPNTSSGCTSARSNGPCGSGHINPDGSATGQVIAVRETGKMEIPANPCCSPSDKRERRSS